MNRSKSFVMFILFMACFFAGLTLKFQYFTIDQNESPEVYAELLGAGILSGVFLGLSLRALNGRKKFFRSLSEGIGITLALFVSVNIAESILSDNFYETHHNPEAFSQLTGHCGVAVGRTVLKLVHQQEPPPEDSVSEFQLDQYCRLRHLDYVIKYKDSFCSPGEDKIECLTRWMLPVAEHGYWNHKTRTFFFDHVMKAWPNSKKDEALVGYALKDLDLESGRQSILRQVGMDESLNERYLFMQGKDELNNLLLTKQIFETISPMLSKPDDSGPPPPYLFKFKDTQADLQNKLAKIPELQKELEQLSSRPNL